MWTIGSAVIDPVLVHNKLSFQPGEWLADLHSDTGNRHWALATATLDGHQHPIIALM